MKFKVALYPSEEGVAVSVPSLPGCWSQGETEEEALINSKGSVLTRIPSSIPIKV